MSHFIPNQMLFKQSIKSVFFTGGSQWHTRLKIIIPAHSNTMPKLHLCCIAILYVFKVLMPSLPWSFHCYCTSSCTVFTSLSSSICSSLSPHFVLSLHHIYVVMHLFSVPASHLHFYVTVSSRVSRTLLRYLISSACSLLSYLFCNVHAS